MNYSFSESDAESLQIWTKELREFQLDSLFDTNVLARAYLYTKSINITKDETDSVEAIMGESNKYKTEIMKDNHLIKGSCTCPYDGKCKHLAALLVVLINRNKNS